MEDRVFISTSILLRKRVCSEWNSNLLTIFWGEIDLDTIPILSSAMTIGGYATEQLRQLWIFWKKTFICLICEAHLIREEKTITW
jgi:hypothetical protein